MKTDNINIKLKAVPGTEQYYKNIGFNYASTDRNYNYKNTITELNMKCNEFRKFFTSNIFIKK